MNAPNFQRDEVLSSLSYFFPFYSRLCLRVSACGRIVGLVVFM